MLTDADKFRDLVRKEAGQVFIPRWTGGLAQWSEKHVMLPDSAFGGKFLLKQTPWLEGIFDAFLDPTVETIVVEAAAQTGKSTLLIALVQYIISEQPGPMLFTLHTEDALDHFLTNKVNPSFQASQIVSKMMPKEKGKDLKYHLVFPNMFIIYGAGNMATARAHAARYIFADEAARYRPGVIKNLEMRTRTFYNRKILLTSTPMNTSHEQHQRFLLGSQSHWALQCLSCKERFVPKMPNIKWEYDKSERFKTTNHRLVCPHCQHPHKQEDAVIQAMNDGGGYMHMNPDPDPKIKSFTYTSIPLYESLCSWESLAKSFLMAVKAAKAGIFEHIMEFNRLEMGKAFDDDMFEDIIDVVVPDPTPKEFVDGFKRHVRALTVDVQKESFWYVVRDWDKQGNSMLVEAGQCFTFDEIVEIQKRLDVRRVSLDGKYRRTEVVKHCALNKWYVFYGSPTPHFVHTYQGRRIQRYVESGKAEKLSNYTCKSFRFATQSCKEVLQSIRNKKMDVEWRSDEHAIALDDPLAYYKQMSSNVLKQVVERKTGQKTWRWEPRSETYPDHFFDCENNQIVWAILAKLDFATDLEREIEAKQKVAKLNAV